MKKDNKNKMCHLLLEYIRQIQILLTTLKLLEKIRNKIFFNEWV